MPITIKERAEPFTEASLESFEPPLLIESHARQVLLHELRRYCRREISGRSFLIAGHRGAGKTTLALDACEQALKESLPLRPLIVMLQGTNLLPNTKDELPLAVGGKEKSSDQQTISAMENVLQQIILGLYRSIAREFTRSFNARIEQPPERPLSRVEWETWNSRKSHRAEMGASLELELDEYPGRSRLREYWRRAGSLTWGVLPSKDPRFSGPRPGEAQGFRELLALCSACGAYRRICGTFTSKQEEKSGAKESEERKLAMDFKGKEIIGAFLPLLVGAFAGTGALAAHAATGPQAAFVGALTALAGTVVFKYSSSRSRDRSNSRADLFIPNLSVATLDRVLPVLIERVRAAGLAPIFVVDELDKVNDLSGQIREMVRRLKKLVAENAFFCFLTDRTYYEQMRHRIEREPYSIEYTYFTHPLFVIFNHRHLHDYLDKVIDRPMAPYLASNSPTSSGDLGAQTEVNRDRADAEILPYILLFESKMHPIDLRRELARIQGEGGRVLLPPGLIQGGHPRYRLELSMQVAIEKILDEPDLRIEFERSNAYTRLAYDALYYLTDRWRDPDVSLDLESAGAKLEFKKYLCSRMETDPKDGSAKKKAGPGEGQNAPRSPARKAAAAKKTGHKVATVAAPVEEPPAGEEPVPDVPTITQSDLDFLWGKVIKLAELLCLPGEGLEAAVRPKRVTTPSLMAARGPAAGSGLRQIPEVVLKAISRGPLLARVPGGQPPQPHPPQQYTWRWTAAGRPIGSDDTQNGQKDVRLIQAFAEAVEKCTDGAVDLGALGSNYSVVPASPPWNSAREAMERLAAPSEDEYQMPRYEDMEVVRQFAEMLKNNGAVIANALLAAHYLGRWAPESSTSPAVQLGLTAICTALELRTISTKDVQKQLSEMADLVMQQRDPQARRGPPPTIEDGKTADWIAWVNDDPEQIEPPSPDALAAIRQQAWEYWQLDTEGPNLADLICCERGIGPWAWLRLPLDSMSINQWSRAFIRAGTRTSHLPEEPPPPVWFAVVALMALGFDVQMGQERSSNDENMRSLFGPLSDEERKELRSLPSFPAGRSPEHRALIYRMSKSEIGSWMVNPEWPVITLTEEEWDLITRSQAELLREILKIDFLIYDRTSPLVATDDDSVVGRPPASEKEARLDTVFYSGRTPGPPRNILVRVGDTSRWGHCVQLVDVRDSADLFRRLLARAPDGAAGTGTGAGTPQ